MAQELIQDTPHGVVGESAIEGFDQLSGDEVADTIACGDGVSPDRDQQVALAGACGTHQAAVLLGADPLEAGQIVHGGLGDGGVRHFEGVEGLDGGKGRGFEPSRLIGGVAGGDLGFDEGAQELLGGPALCLGGLQEFGCQRSDTGELEAGESCEQVWSECGKGGRGHGSTSRRA